SYCDSSDHCSFPTRRSSDLYKETSLLVIVGLYGGMGMLYIFTDEQLCNNYLIVEQRALGWGFLIIAISLLVYILQSKFIDYSQRSEEHTSELQSRFELVCRL